MGTVWIDDEVKEYIVRAQGKLMEATRKQVRQPEAIRFLYVLSRAIPVFVTRIRRDGDYTSICRYSQGFWF